MLMRKIILLLAFSINIFIKFDAVAAPRVPDILTQNGLIYCTYANSFSFNPQTADIGASMNVVTEQIYNKLFEFKNNSAKLLPVLATSYDISNDGKVITTKSTKRSKISSC